jgi:hypothetical protein
MSEETVMTTNVAEISELDRASVLHPFTQLRDFATGKAGDPTIVESGTGIRIRMRPAANTSMVSPASIV